MTFLAPWMLFGALAASIPVILHFFYRARYRPVPWAAMKFLRLSLEQTSRRLRFQELILLLLRILVLIVLALALARPSSLITALQGGRGESVDAILVFDLSYSMSAKEGSKTRLERAKEAALSVVDNLPQSSTVQIITCTDRAVAVGPRSPGNLDQARELIKKLETTSQATDFLAGFNEAVLAFERCQGGNKEVYLFSDMQKLGWERQGSAVRAKCEEMKAQANLYLVRCTDRPIKNAAVIGIQTQTGIPHTGSRTGFTVLVRNSSSEPVSKLTLTLEVDGKPLETDAQAIDSLGPGEVQAITLTGRLEKAGWQVLTARLQSDDLEEDNRYDKVLLVRDQVRVLVIDGTPNEREPDKAGSFFLGHALLPVAEQLKANYHIQPRIVRPSEASAALLTDRDICIFCNVSLELGTLNAEFLQRLEEWVREGHGLIIGSGSNVRAENYERAFGPKPTGLDLLPFPIHQSLIAPEQSPWTFDTNSIDGQSFLAKFRDNPLNQIARVETNQLLTVVEPTGEQSQANVGRVLFRFHDGKPAVMTRAVGDGEVIFLATSLDLSWGIFPVMPSFTPFVHSTLTYLVQRASTPYNRVAGEIVRFSPSDALRQHYWIKPNNDRIRLGTAQGGTNGERLLLTTADTTKAGIYRLLAEGEESGNRFAIVPDLRESEDLQSLTDTEIDQTLGFQPIHFTTGGEANQFAGTERSKREWTVWILGLLLCLALVESIWAFVCGRAW